jgi:ADP-ribose pyrophosphatase
MRSVAATAAPGFTGLSKKNDFAVIVSMEADGSIHLVEQYRYPVGARFWELPQGAWQSADAPDPLDLARGELREETGLDAGKLDLLGDMFVSYGYATQRFYVFVATELTPGEPKLDAEELGLISRRFDWPEVRRMLTDGIIKDGETMAAFGLLASNGILPL